MTDQPLTPIQPQRPHHETALPEALIEEILGVTCIIRHVPAQDPDATNAYLDTLCARALAQQKGA